MIDGSQIFMLLNLNAVMSIIANVPAAVASTVSTYIVPSFVVSRSHILQIVACRAVRRLTNYTCQGPEVFAYVAIVTPSSISY